MKSSIIFERFTEHIDSHVSIVIPSFNTNFAYIYDCLLSLKKQSILNGNFRIEIIIVLNGDLDPSFSVLVKAIDEIFTSSDYVYIKVIYAEVKGVSNARNIGINFSKSRYICFIDDDDWVSNQYLEELYLNVTQNFFPLATLYDYIDGEIKEESYYNKQFMILEDVEKMSLIDVRSWFSLPVLKMFDRELIGKHRFNTSLSNGEDGLFVFDALNSKLRFKLTTNKAVYYRRVRQNSLVGKLKRKNIFKRLMHAVHLSSLYLIHYLKNGCRYNIVFFGTRLLAPFRHVIK